MADLHELPAPVELDKTEARLVELRAKGEAWRAVAKALGCAVSTAWRTAQRPHVAAALGEAERRELGDVRAFLRAAQMRAAKALVRIALDKDTPASVAVPALREILARGLGPAPEAAPDASTAPPSPAEIRKRWAGTYGQAPGGAAAAVGASGVQTSAHGASSGGADGAQTSAHAARAADGGES